MEGKETGGLWQPSDHSFLKAVWRMVSKKAYFCSEVMGANPHVCKYIYFYKMPQENLLYTYQRWPLFYKKGCIDFQHCEAWMGEIYLQQTPIDWYLCQVNPASLSSTVLQLYSTKICLKGDKGRKIFNAFQHVGGRLSAMVFLSVQLSTRMKKGR